MCLAAFLIGGDRIGHSVIRPIREDLRGHYGSRVLTLARSLWRLPAPADARPPGRADHALVLAVALVALVETLARPDMRDGWITFVSFMVWLPTLLVRRTRPLLMTSVFVTVVLVLWLRTVVTGAAQADDLNSAVIGLLIPYSLARWARGKDALTGLVLFWSAAATALSSQELSVADQVGGTAVVIAAIAVGAAVRTRSLLHLRQLDDVRQHERERLARDLHDTVAHHLTAIAITAQAGLAVSGREPTAATDALRRIDEEATRTLAETRKVLRMLRDDDEAPERPLDDLAGLASAGAPGLRVEVLVDEGLGDLSPTVGAAVHRIAQEAVVNARRHAADATLVRVEVTRVADHLVLTVSDDGRAPTGHGDGFGIVGMTERATLLGGTLDAGPREAGGWEVRAVLPMEDLP